MNQHAEILDDDDAAPSALVDVSQSLAVGLQRAEIDQLVSTAKRFPRSLKEVQKRVLSMAILDEESAAECMYALPRGGKPIMGPSIRFAEILKQSYGNCTSGARVVHVDRVEMYVEAEGVFVDLETNSRTTGRVRRRISTKNGKLLNDDMIIVTGNAACSIALRNSILGGVPKPLWRGAWDMVQRTIAGDVKTLAVKRAEAVKAFAQFGVTPARVFEALGVAGEEDVNVEHIPVLRGMYSALRNGESTVEEMFSGTLPAKSTHEKIVDPLSDEAPAPNPTADASQPAAPANEGGDHEVAQDQAIELDSDTPAESREEHVSSEALASNGETAAPELNLTVEDAVPPNPPVGQGERSAASPGLSPADKRVLTAFAKTLRDAAATSPKELVAARTVAGKAAAGHPRSDALTAAVERIYAIELRVIADGLSREDADAQVEAVLA